MQPYQEASQEIRRQGETPLKALKTLGSVAGTAATFGAGAAIAKRVLPFLSPYISEDLAIKGLSKIDPRFGNFINTAKTHGTPFEEIKEFIKQKATGGEEQEEEPFKKAEVEDENIIKQYSPKLFSMVEKAIQGGRTIEEVEGIARSPEHKFDKTIKNMENSLGMTFYDIVRSVFGGPKRNEKQDKNMAAQGQQQMQPQQPQQQNAPGQGQKALLDIMQKINQKLGG